MSHLILQRLISFGFNALPLAINKVNTEYRKLPRQCCGKREILEFAKFLSAYSTNKNSELSEKNVGEQFLNTVNTVFTAYLFRAQLTLILAVALLSSSWRCFLLHLTISTE